MRLFSQTDAPPQSLLVLLMRLCSQMPRLRSPLALVLLAVMLADSAVAPPQSLHLLLMLGGRIWMILKGLSGLL